MQVAASDPPRFEVPRGFLLAPAGLCLLAGLAGAMQLAGLPTPLDVDRLEDVHGMVLVLGFLGTLIALERAVALRQPLGYGAPVLLGLSGIALVISPLNVRIGQVGLVLGTAALTALWRRRHDVEVLVQVLAAGLATVAAILWLGVDVEAFIPWLSAFIVLIIAGERVELARITMNQRTAQVILVLACFLAAALIASLLWPSAGTRAFGAVLLVLVAWLARYDVARRMVRAHGLPRFSATAILLGYGWLSVAAITWLTFGVADTTAGYDVTIHAVFLGFAMSMVMAHAPIILPAVLRRPLPYSRWSWLPLVLLHLGLIVRLAIGDVVDPEGRVWEVGAALTITALVLFVVVSAALSVHSSLTTGNKHATPRGNSPS